MLWSLDKYKLFNLMSFKENWSRNTLDLMCTACCYCNMTFNICFKMKEAHHSSHANNIIANQILINYQFVVFITKSRISYLLAYYYIVLTVIFICHALVILHKVPRQKCRIVAVPLKLSSNTFFDLLSKFPRNVQTSYFLVFILLY